MTFFWFAGSIFWHQVQPIVSFSYSKNTFKMFKGIQKDKLQTGGTKSWWCKSWCKRKKDFQLKKI